MVLSTARPTIRHCVQAQVEGSGFPPGKTLLHVAVFAPYLHRFIFTIERVLPAVHVAEDYIKERGLLSGYRFHWLPGDSRCNSRDAAMHAFDAVTRYKVALFLGPVCDFSLAPVARYAPYWNIPIIGPGGFAHNFGEKLKGSEGAEYPLLTRMGTTFNSMALTFIDFFRHFGWGKVRILYDSHTRNEIVPRFCHLAGGALGSYLRNDRRLKFDLYQLLEYSNEFVTRTLEDELGTEYSGTVLFLEGFQKRVAMADYLSS
ncbi:atrial natriuretic peptide receptor 3-like [Babylonia areolata]|uniref:atrial natriuretic peptide receptor 3-like n=1 Tax=Babylonia areolata TaxID=304850 RepID=UPI003FCF6C77